MKTLQRGLLVLLVLALLLALGLRLRYGGGPANFPDRTGTPLLPASALQVVASLPTPPGNIAVSAGGRVFVSLHPEARPRDKLVELVNGQAQPFPSAAFQTGVGEPRFFRDVLGIRVDAQNRLWTLDNGFHGLHPGRLLAFDLASGAVVHEYVFPRALAGVGSHLNDFNVSADGQRIYIAEASFFGQTPALIVYDTAQRQARRVLEGHPSVQAEFFTPVVQGRRMTAFGLVDIRPGVDSIALSRDGQWLYFAAITAQKMYRLRTADLDNPVLSPAALAERVQAFADKTMSDGITTDDAGRVYLTDPEHSAILRVLPDGRLETLLKTDTLRWPDGLSFGPDGWLYVTGSSLHEVIGRAPSNVAAQAPYPVWRFQPGAQAAAGQ